MCPVCITTAALIAGSVTSTGGLAAVVIRKLGIKNTTPAPNPATNPGAPSQTQLHRD
jgi:hypothetical protein